MQTAFVLGAGLGTRLRPLTDHLPKPLIPFGGRPLICYAFDHLLELGIDRLIVNTHHCPEAYREAFPRSEYEGVPITFVHEPVLLETGGGLANIRPLLSSDEGLVVYNGDILTDLPLAPALETHRRSGEFATLIVRSDHPEKRITLEDRSGLIVDMRNQLLPDRAPNCGFTGIYFLGAEFLSLLPEVGKFSIVSVFLDLIRQGRPIRGVLANSGGWADLGDRDAYLATSAERFPAPVIADSAMVDPSAVIEGATVVGPGARVGAGVSLTDSILWEDARVAPGASLQRCVVRSGQLASGRAEDYDF